MNQQAQHRDWSLYNQAQTQEKLLAMRLISHAVDFLQIPYEYKGNGRPHISVDDMLKCLVFKVFNNFSSRRTMCDIRLAHALGYIQEVPHFNSLSNYMGKEEITTYLHRLYKVLAMPLRDVETTFAIDGSGFSNLRKNSWIDYRLQKKRITGWKKLHIVTGVTSTIVASATISEGRRHDSPYFESLIRSTAKDFKILEVLADSGYISKDNCNTVEECGGIPFILPKKNVRVKRLYHYRKNIAWRR
ncbi:MAG: transposase, partial [Candidatus Aenigmarchaeota archaeon]|nr:transposase [Candidatus Aenigmarchaeota archaeon]